KAVNDKDTSYYSEAVSIMTPPLPSAPDTVNSPFPKDDNKEIYASDGNLTLSWKGSDNTLSYILYFGDNPNNLGKIAEVKEASYQISGLTKGGKYYWRVDAVNAIDTTQGKIWFFETSGGSISIHKGLVGYWSLDETGSVNRVTDSSEYHNNGILGIDATNPEIRVPVYRNNGFSFKNLKRYTFGIQIPDQKQLFLDTRSFTISFWMRAKPSLMPTDEATSVYLLCKGSIGTDTDIGTTGKRFDLEIKQSKLRFALDAGDEGNAGKDELQTDANPMFTGKWVNVIAIRDTIKQKMKIYLDGKLVAEKGIKNSKYGIGERSALNIGNIGEIELSTGTFTPAPYRGDIDEIKIYNYVLSPSKIASLSEFVPKGLVGYWSFDQSSDGSIAIDSSLFQNNGELGSGITYLKGHNNDAINMENLSENGYGVKIPDEYPIYLDKSAFSISLWMKADPSLMPT